MDQIHYRLFASTQIPEQFLDPPQQEGKVLIHICGKVVQQDPKTNGALPYGTNNLANYDPGALSQTIWFRRTVKSSVCDSSQSNVVQVRVNPNPVLTAISGDRTDMFRRNN